MGRLPLSTRNFLVFAAVFLECAVRGTIAQLSFEQKVDAKLAANVRYQVYLRTAEKFLEAKGKYNPVYDRKFSACTNVTHAHGCVSYNLLCEYLQDKWIPGFEAIPVTDGRFILPGHWSSCPRNERTYEADERPSAELALGQVLVRQTLHDFAAYLLTRPQDALPPQVVGMLQQTEWGPLPWPGGRLGGDRTRFLPLPPAAPPDPPAPPSPCGRGHRCNGLPPPGPSPPPRPPPALVYEESDMEPWRDIEKRNIHALLDSEHHGLHVAMRRHHIEVLHMYDRYAVYIVGAMALFAVGLAFSLYELCTAPPPPAPLAPELPNTRPFDPSKPRVPLVRWLIVELPLRCLKDVYAFLFVSSSGVAAFGAEHLPARNADRRIDDHWIADAVPVHLPDRVKPSLGKGLALFWKRQFRAPGATRYREGKDGAALAIAVHQDQMTLRQHYGQLR